MAGPSRVGALPATGAATPPGRMLLLDGRYSGNPIEGVFGGAAVGFDGQWRSFYDDGSGFGGFGQSPRQRGEPARMPFTPLMARLAAAYPASEAHASDLRVPPPVFLTDLLHGVGVYEFNMRIVAGGMQPQGSVINRYS